MTAVYAASKMVLVVQTSEGVQEGPNRYSNRTWTLQECVMNGNTRVVSLDGEVSGPVSDDVRSELSGIRDSDGVDLQGMSDISSYTWVLPGEELQRAQEIAPEIREAYAAISKRRTNACSDDKAMALGQVIFRVLFPQEKQSIRFFQEIVWLHATQLGTGSFQKLLMLIDNTGWRRDEMTGEREPQAAPRGEGWRLPDRPPRWSGTPRSSPTTSRTLRTFPGESSPTTTGSPGRSASPTSGSPERGSLSPSRSSSRRGPFRIASSGS